MIKIALLVIVVILLFVVLFIGFELMNYVIKPERPSLETYIKREAAYWGNFDSYEKELFDVESFDGYVLHGELIKNNNSKKYVIVTHGWSANRYGSVKYANIFYDLGYNVYIYDLRYHGVNEETFCSMGKYESRDVIAIQEALFRKFGDDITIGLHGESLGCASTIMALGLSQKFSFVVADCGYEDLKMLLVDQVHKLMHMPTIMAYVANGWLLLIHHYSFFSIRPIDSLDNNQVPVLFIHGGNDDFIISEHSKMAFEKCEAMKKLYIFDGAGHADSYYNNPDKYIELVNQFVLLIEK